MNFGIYQLQLPRYVRSDECDFSTCALVRYALEFCASVTGLEVMFGRSRHLQAQRRQQQQRHSSQGRLRSPSSRRLHLHLR